MLGLPPHDPRLPRFRHVHRLHTDNSHDPSNTSALARIPPSSPCSTNLSLAEQRWLERAVEEQILADAAVETAKAAADMSVEIPTAEEQEWMEGEMQEASEEHAWLERQASDAARRVAVLKATLRQQDKQGADISIRPLAAALPSPFTPAQERWLASEVEAHVQKEAAAAAAVHMTQAASRAGVQQPSKDEEEWLEAEISKAEEEHCWLERQASDAAHRVIALSKIVSPRGTPGNRLPLAAALPSPLTAAQERWLAAEVEAHKQREIAASAAIDTVRAMQETQPISSEEQEWIEQEMNRQAEEHSWLERQASDAARRLAMLQSGDEAMARADDGHRSIFKRPMTVPKNLSGRPAFDRPLLPAAPAPAVSADFGRAFEDLHRIREQLAAIRRISSEADEVLDAMETGSLEMQPRLKTTLQQLHHDCGRLRAKGDRVLATMANAGPAARASSLQASEALSQAADALRERIEGQLRVYELAGERQSVLQLRA